MTTPYKIRPNSNETFLEQARALHNNKYIYPDLKFINVSTKINIQCDNPTHPVFQMRPSDHLRPRGCIRCAQSLPYTNETFLERARSIHGDKFDYPDLNYKNKKTPIAIKCKADPNHPIFYQRPDDHTNGKQGCPECGGTKRLTNEEFIKRARKVHGDKYSYPDLNYTNNRTKINIKCSNPSHPIFQQTPTDHLGGHGCWRCSSSSLEEFITSYTFKNGKSVLLQQRYGNSAQRDDFRLMWLKNQPHYEGDGQQHFNAYNFGSETITPEEAFLDQQERDLRKNLIVINQSNEPPMIRVGYRVPLDDKYYDWIFNHYEKTYIHNNTIPRIVCYGMLNKNTNNHDYVQMREQLKPHNCHEQMLLINIEL